MEEFELYGQDTWRVSSGLTVTAGLRWSLTPPVSEVNGAQVSILPTYEDFVNRRIALAEAGRPSREAGLISYIASHAPGGEPLYPFHRRNVAPRVAVAYTPQTTEGRLGRLFGGPGRTSFRAGAGMYYDLFGMELMEQLDRHAFGLSSTIQSEPLQHSLESAPRFSGITSLPPGLVPDALPGGPGTPPETFGDFQVVDSRIKAGLGDGACQIPPSAVPRRSPQSAMACVSARSARRARRLFSRRAAYRRYSRRRRSV